MSMQNSKVLKGILFVCGLILILVGGSGLFGPESFTSRNGIDISENLSLFNDYRTFGSLMFGSGLIIMLGVFHSRMAFTSSVVAAVMFTIMTFGRALSIVIDGVPAEGLVRATVVEGILAAVAIFALAKYREKG